MSTTKTLNEPKSSTLSGTTNFIDRVKEIEDTGEFTKAAEAMGDWWEGIGVKPDVNGLPAHKKAAVLLRIGVLSGWLGSMQQVAGSQEKAKDLISEAANLFDSIGDRQNWGEARSDLAVCYWREGAFEEARIVLQDVLESGFDPSPELLGKILLRAVNVEISTRHYEKAMELVTRAASIASKGSALLRGKLYFHRALIQRGEGEDKGRKDLLLAAVEDYQKAGVHYKKAKHDIYVANSETNLGNVYRLLSDYQNAHSHFDRAIYIYTKLKDQAHAAQVYECKAQALLAEDQLKDAESAARQSVAMIRKGDAQSLLAESLTTLGVVLGRRGNFAEAVHSFVEAKEAALMVDDLESAGNAVLTQLEELQSDLSPAVFRSLYLEADELLKRSPQQSTYGRLQRIARRQFEDGQPGETPDSQKMAKLLSYADKLDSLFENEDNAAFNWENFSLPEAVRTYEGEIILKALSDSSGRVTKAAQLLGVSHQNLSLILHQRHKELKKYCAPRKPRSKTKINTH